MVIVYTNIDLYSSYKFYVNIDFNTSFIISFAKLTSNHKPENYT